MSYFGKNEMSKTILFGSSTSKFTSIFWNDWIMIMVSD
jgi:hypothetical protein